jgi:hypothetical protein
MTKEFRHSYWVKLEKEGKGKIIDGEFYHKTANDPLVDYLQEELNRPCYNCECYRTEVETLRNHIEALATINDLKKKEGT